MGASSKKVPSNVCKICKFTSSCTWAKYHEDLSCSSFIHSVVSNDCISGQWYPDQTVFCAGWSMPLWSTYARRFVFAWHVPETCYVKTYIYLYAWYRAPGKRGSQQIIFFLFLHENIWCADSLEVPHRGTSNEYWQHMFPCRDNKYIDTFFALKTSLVWRYVDINVLKIQPRLLSSMQCGQYLLVFLACMHLFCIRQGQIATNHRLAWVLAVQGKILGFPQWAL